MISKCNHMSSKIEGYIRSTVNLCWKPTLPNGDERCNVFPTNCRDMCAKNRFFLNNGIERNAYCSHIATGQWNATLWFATWYVTWAEHRTQTREAVMAGF